MSVFRHTVNRLYCHIVNFSFTPGDFGDVHFDDEEHFTVTSQAGAVDLRWLALHELGHSLGLAHSSNKRAIMYPIYSDSLSGLKLNRDDVMGIQQLYGELILQERLVNIF